MKGLGTSVVIAALIATIAVAAAQTYPARPVTIIAPFPAGGPLDTIARIISEPMRSALGQPVVIENVAGAGGNLGTGRVARAPADGYTVGIGQWSTHVVNPVTYKLPYDVLNDFEPVALLTITPQLIIARKDFPARDVKELIAWLKANPDQATAATVGAAGGAQVSASTSSRPPARASVSCPIAAGGRRCRTWSRGQVDRCSTRRRTRSLRSAAARSRPTR